VREAWHLRTNEITDKLFVHIDFVLVHTDRHAIKFADDSVPVAIE
jgi:hypothetical protein